MPKFCYLFVFCCLGLTIPLAASADQTTDMLQGAIADWQSGNAKQALIQADKATQNIWQKTPLYIRKFLLTATKASSYGVYQERADNVYSAAKDTILLYVEPVGYRITENAQGLYEFGFTSDLAILDTKGNILVGKENFMAVNFKSHTFNREIFLNITVNIGGLPPGDYFLGLRIKDTGGQSTPLRVPITFQ
ncbi:MAG: hypothetical protein KKE29_00720 [Proteobacteria bacterium]|nr:hypothetical protein [Pseudomonadota bacterium]MBU4576691.1 hypothetical protein [Pseudomonadota bacterium]MBU4597192.1 hypothetical protein [Pseudomonadota bacterium]